MNNAESPNDKCQSFDCGHPRKRHGVIYLFNKPVCFKCYGGVAWHEFGKPRYQ